jgi:hypothetical protein
MQKIIRSKLFDYLGKNIKTLDLYPDIFNSSEPIRVHANFILSSKSKGIQIVLTKKLEVESIILLDRCEDYDRYQGTMPAGLSFDLSRAQVRELLGEPDYDDDGAYVDGDVYEANDPDSNDRQYKYMEIIYTDNCDRIQVIKLEVKKKQNFLTNLLDSLHF